MIKYSPINLIWDPVELLFYPLFFLWSWLYWINKKTIKMQDYWQPLKRFTHLSLLFIARPIIIVFVFAEKRIFLHSIFQFHLNFFKAFYNFKNIYFKNLSILPYLHFLAPENSLFNVFPYLYLSFVYYFFNFFIARMKHSFTSSKISFGQLNSLHFLLSYTNSINSRPQN